jgi:hypothetical protein
MAQAMKAVRNRKTVKSQSPVARGVRADAHRETKVRGMAIIGQTPRRDLDLAAKGPL